MSEERLGPCAPAGLGRELTPALLGHTLLWVLWSETVFAVGLLAQSCPTLCDPMDRSMPGFPVHHQLPELTQTHVL